MNRLWSAIQQKLDTLAERIGLTSLALANEDGLVIAASGAATEVEMMAAVSPLLQTGDELLRQYCEQLQQKGLGMNVFDVHHGGHSLFLCATGADTQIHHPELQQMLEQIADQLMPV